MISTMGEMLETFTKTHLATISNKNSSEYITATHKGNKNSFVADDDDDTADDNMELPEIVDSTGNTLF